MKERQPVNYIYFGIIFLILSILHIYHVFLIENATFLHRIFYTTYALGQCALEVGGLIVAGHLVARVCHQKVNTVFVALTLLLFLVHLIDFPLVRIMGMSIWYAMSFVLTLSWENFVELLYATHISITSWILGGLALVLLPIFGILFFRFTHIFAKQKPLHVSYPVMGVSLLSVMLFLVFFDFKVNKITASAEEPHFLKALPWKTTLFSSDYPMIKIAKLPQKPSQEECFVQLNQRPPKAEKKPNIYLFIAESLREDYLTKEVAPSLFQFKTDNTAFRHSLAAANGTHLSWFSIFHSVYPFYWETRSPQKWQAGSLPLQILKKAGYRVHVYSASRLNFYHMDTRLLGPESHLADTCQLFGENELQEAHESDSACIRQVMQEMDAYQEGHVFIIFLESTHFGYSFPAEGSLCSAPPAVDYFNLTCSNDDIEGVRSRYKNAVHFIDGLFGQFIEKLKTVPNGEESVVIFTGDHGEEFFEEGRVFHASHLSPMQTSVPIYYRLGSTAVPGTKQITSHLDIFPTVLNYVLGAHPFEAQFESWFDGESILNPKKKNFAISTKFHGIRTPCEFLIHDGKNQLISRFNDEDSIFESDALKIMSLRDENNELQPVDLEKIKADFKPALQSLFTD